MQKSFELNRNDPTLRTILTIHFSPKANFGGFWIVMLPSNCLPLLQFLLGQTLLPDSVGNVQLITIQKYEQQCGSTV